MAGFTVAGFDFGQNIENNRIRREQIAASAAASARSAALQARGQDIQKEESEARLAELRASRESADALREQELAERGAAREEGARQFDERMDLANRQHDDEQKEKKHKQSWDDKLNEQKLAGLQQEFDKRNVELERIMAIRQKEDEERAHQQELIESAYGDAVIAAELGGGFLSPGQIEDFNKRNNTDYNYVGKVDPTTGKPFEDGKLHFLTYQLDENGQVVMDEQSGRPMLTTDNPISAEFYGRVMDGYFGKFKDVMGKGGGQGVEIAKINAAAKQAAEEGKDRRAGIVQRLKEDKFLWEVNKEANKAAQDIFLRLSDEQKESWMKDYGNFISQMKEKYGNKAPIKKGDNGEEEPVEGQEIDVSGARNKEEFNKILAEAPEGAILSLKGETRIKRNGKWVVVKK